MAATKNSLKRPVNLLHQRAYVELKRRLLSGELPAGAFLSERQIAADLEMSKTPVKAAFARLEHDGFLTISPQQGVVVRDLSIDEILDHVELRIALETYVVRQLAERGLSPSEWTTLEKHLTQQAQSAESREVSASVQLDGDFHLLLCDFLGNKELEKVMSQIRDKMFRVMGRILHRHPDRTLETHEEHAAMASAIREGRSQLAAELMVQHIERGKQFLIDPRSSARTQTAV